MRALLGRLVPLVWWVPLALATIAGLGVIKVLSDPGTSVGYAQTSRWLAFLTLTAGLTLVVAALVHLPQRRGPWSVVLPGLAAVTWFAPTWIGWQEAPDLARSLAEPLSALLVPTVLLIVVSHGDSFRARTGSASTLLFLGVVVTSVLVVLFRNPYLDAGCWANCTTNVFLVSAHPALSKALQAGQTALVAAACLALVALAGSRIRSSQDAARDREVLVVLPGCLLGLAGLGRLIELHRAGVENPYDGFLEVLFAGSALSLVLLGAVLVADVTRSLKTRAAIDRVVRDLGQSPAPGFVEQALGEAVGDASMTVAYRLPGTGGYVDARGEAVGAPVQISGRTTTHITRHGEPIAVVTCRSAVAHHLDSLGPALLLGLENERLQAGLMSQLEDLRRSRARIVAATDHARSSLERDLHDGAQQHLLALSFDLRLALSSAVRNGDDCSVDRLTMACDLAHQALGELRTLAHGLFPAALDRGGLHEALTTLAEVAPIAVRLQTTTTSVALPAPVASAGYFATLLALDDAAGRGATKARVATELRDTRLVLSIADDGSSRSTGLMALTDRVGALGGTVSIGAHSCEVVIPCG